MTIKKNKYLASWSANNATTCHRGQEFKNLRDAIHWARTSAEGNRFGKSDCHWYVSLIPQPGDPADNVIASGGRRSTGGRYRSGRY